MHVASLVRVLCARRESCAGVRSFRHDGEKGLFGQILTRRPTDEEVTIAEQGGVDAILSAMKEHASVAAVQEAGCRALRNLAGVNAENQVTLPVGTSRLARKGGTFFDRAR